MDIIEISKIILERTSGGLELIQSVYPQARPRKLFKVREERTESCSLKKMPDGNWVLKDFGSAAPAKNGVQIYAEANGISFSEAVRVLARAHQIPMGNETWQKNEATFKKIDLSQWKEDVDFDENGFAFQTKDFTKSELAVLGPFVEPETCHKYHLFSLKWYAIKKEGRITKVEPTETFPIFIFCFSENNTKFYKIYQPKAEDKKWRFFWKGKKPQDYIGGLDVLRSEMKRRQAEEAASLADDSTDDVEQAKKIDKVFLCSGERDAINMASLGYFVIWQNSETAEMEPEVYRKIMSMTEELFNIPDLDDTGKTQGHSLAMKYLDIKTLWLPSWIRKRRDWRGNARKDLCDFFDLVKHDGKYKVETQIKKMIPKAYPMRFWDEKINQKTGAVSYAFNNVHAFNFLYRNGFCRLNVKETKEGYKFVRVEEHIVREIKSIEVKDFINKFLEERDISTAIRNMVYNTTRLSESQIANLPRVDLDFTDYTRSSQFFFFSHESWQVSKNGILPLKKNTKKRYVWDDDIIDRRINEEYPASINLKNIKVESPYFRCKKGELAWDIEILDSSCEFLNFLIQTSRMYWQEELETGWESEEEQEQYAEKHKFDIAGQRLTEEQRAEQKAHLVNKIFMLGYLMHRYKHPNKAWAVYAMENVIIDDTESHGGSGKSIILKTPGKLMNWKSLDARKTGLWDDKHLFDGVDKHTDYILFDDADRGFKISNLYSAITGPLNVNPKNNQPYTIPFRDAPKYAISSNYSLREGNTSTTRRLLFTALSDYYHANGDLYHEKKDPTDDFGHALFTDWTDVQWNKLFNFLAQCTQFYLSVDEKINPPMDQVLMRNLQSQIGTTYMEWADEWLTERLNQEFWKKEALEDFKVKNPNMRSISATNFIKKMKAWSKFHGHEFMPNEVTDASGRIQKQHPETGKREDALFIKSLEEPESPEESKPINELPF